MMKKTKLVRGKIRKKIGGHEHGQGQNKKKNEKKIIQGQNQKKMIRSQIINNK